LEIAGRPLVIEIGQVAKQANGAAMVRYGDTAVLVTATASKSPREGIDFFPLTVDYEEKQYAAGKIPGGFIKREGRATELATLSARQIDRPIRPLFPKGYKNDVHIVATVMSVDKNNAPDITAVIGASIALGVSDIPFAGPVGAVIVGLVDGELIINPTVEQLSKSDLHLAVAGTAEAIMMVEGSANEIPEATMIDAIFFAHEEIKKIVAFQEPIIQELGLPKSEVIVEEISEEIEQAVREYAQALLEEAVYNPDKKMRESQMEVAREEIQEHFAEIYPDNAKDVAAIVDKMMKEIVRKAILEKGERVDGRRLDEIRAISCEVGYLPRPHVSNFVYSLFGQLRYMDQSFFACRAQHSWDNLDKSTKVHYSLNGTHIGFSNFHISNYGFNIELGLLGSFFIHRHDVKAAVVFNIDFTSGLINYLMNSFASRTDYLSNPVRMYLHLG
jgi:polyribonucleotide nucleotidyltransferase